MQRSSRWITGFAVALTAGAAPALSAQQTCKPITGRFEAVVVPRAQGHCPDVPDVFCTAGRVWGGVNGTYEFVMSGAVPAAAIDAVPGTPPTILFFTGRSRVALQSGDLLVGIDTGAIDLPPGLGGFGSMITWSGGTGAMSTASGQMSLRGGLDAATGTTSGDYTGTLCTAS